jgi:enamine deaminase RidA (YjgF/YER057c/UK114 family)
MEVTKSVGHNGRLFVQTNSKTEKWVNYSRAVKDGNWIFVSNTSGFHYDENRIDEDIEGQTRQMIRNITNALETAGGVPQDIVRAVIYCPRPEEFSKALDLISRFFSTIKPAVTAVCAPLAESSLLIEMEVTALLKNA